MPPPLARQPFPLELFDPMRRNFVQDQRSEYAIERLNDLAVPISAPLVQIRMIAEIDFRELPKVMSGCRRIPWRPSRIRARSRASMSSAWRFSPVCVVAR
jgi:hypothetical protein